MKRPLSISSAVLIHVAAVHAEGAAWATVTARRRLLRDFQRFARATRIVSLALVTSGDVEQYQSYLTDRSVRRPQALTLGARRHRLLALRQFLRWAVRTERLHTDPTEFLRVPRAAQRLPRAILTLAEAERILARPDVSRPLGLRDRAMLELLFSSGLRRMEVIAADLGDLDINRCLLFVREGKGRRDRVVPVSARACAWLARYLVEARPKLMRELGSPALFVGLRRNRIARTQMGSQLRQYLVGAGVGKPGACHIWRHTVATLMHDGGADIRDLQQLLGHADLSTTAIYTRVSALRLAEVLRRTHPAYANHVLGHCA